MDRKGDSPQQKRYRCNRCNRCFTDLQLVRDHEKNECKGTFSPESPTVKMVYPAQQAGMNPVELFRSPPRRFVEAKTSPAEKRMKFSPDEGTSKSPCKVVITPPPIISSKPVCSPRTPNQKKVQFSPDLQRSMSPCEKFKSPPSVVSSKIISSPSSAARKLNFLPDPGTSKSPGNTSKTPLEVASGNTINSSRSSTPDRDSSWSPFTDACKSAEIKWRLARRSLKEASELARHLLSLHDEAVEKRDDAIVSCSEAVKREKSLPLDQLVRSDIRVRALAKLEAASEEEKRALESFKEAQRVAISSQWAVSNALAQKILIMKAAESFEAGRDEHSPGSPHQKVSFSPDQRTSTSSGNAFKTPPSRIISSPSSAARKLNFLPDPGISKSPGKTSKTPPSVVSSTIISSPSSAARKLNFLPDPGISKSPGKTSKTPLEVASGNTTNSPRSSTPDRDSSAGRNWRSAYRLFAEACESTRHLLSLYDAAVEKRDEALHRCSEAIKIEKSMPLDQLFKSDIKVRALAELEAASEEERRALASFEAASEAAISYRCVASNALVQKILAIKAAESFEAEGDGIGNEKTEFASESVTHHGRWTQRQLSSLDDPDQHQIMDAATSPSHAAEMLEQSDESPEPMETD